MKTSTSKATKTRPFQVEQQGKMQNNSIGMQKAGASLKSEGPCHFWTSVHGHPKDHVGHSSVVMTG